MAARRPLSSPPASGPLDTVLDTLVANTPRGPGAPAAPVVARIVGLDAQGVPLLDLPGLVPPVPRPARSTVVLGPDAVGRAAVVIFERDDLERPIVVGVIAAPKAPAEDGSVDVVLDGERIVLTAAREVVLRCGSASITLTRAGKVLIRGDYVLSRSSGANRIRGGSVQIN